MCSAGPLMAVPNVSSAAPGVVSALSGACEITGVRLLDVHSDRDHGRSVFTLAGAPETLVDALVGLARLSIELLDIVIAPAGLHPHVGAVDVLPVVYVDDADRGTACAAALVLADRLAFELSLPVLLYCGLAADAPAGQRSRARGGPPRAGGRGPRAGADLRRGGVAGLASRIAAGELVPDFGDGILH